MSKLKGSLFPRFSINRPVTVLMTLLAVLVVGFISFTQIPVELLPQGFIPPFLGVYTPYPNSNPQEVEEQIAKPIEEQCRTINGVRRVNTSSSSNGCWTFIEFRQNTDMDVAYAQLRDRMDRVRAELPDDIERIYLRKFTDDDDPVFWVAMAQNQHFEDPYLLIEQVMKKPLERVDGVAKVEIWGAEEKSILIYINQDKVRSYNINLYETIQQLRNDNFSLASGYVTEGNQKIFVRSVGKFSDLDQLKNLPIRGANLKLKDIAEIKYDVPERRWRQTINGKRGISVGVFKESTANTVELCNNLKKMFEETFKADPKLAGLEIDILFNQGKFIQESIDNLLTTGMWGGLFAFFILYFFLRRFRMTVIITIAIPLTVLVTMTVLYFMGWTLNLITMMGLMISIGMVVDNSIVVLENIYRKRSQGASKKESSLFGSSEVALAITMATMTTVVVFLPLILMNDDTGFQFYMFRIGFPVVISLIASLFIAMIFIPLAATRITSKKEVKEAKVITKANAIYQRMLSWSVTHRLEMGVILLFVMASLPYAISNIKSTDSNGNINDIRLYFEMPDNYTIEDADRVFGTIEDTINVKRDIYGVMTIDARHSHNFGMMRVFLKPQPRRDWYEVVYDNISKQFGNLPGGVMERKDVLEDIMKRIPDFPGITVRTSWRQQAGDDASLSILLFGDDTNTLSDLAKEVERRLSTIDEIISLETDRENGSDEIHLFIKRDQAAKYGISPATISGTVQYALRGIPLPKYQTKDKEIDVHIQLRKEDRKNLSQLKNMTFFSRSGKEIPLDAIATFTMKKGFGEIQRENGKTFLRIKANSTQDDMKSLFGKVDKVMAGFEMPYGYSWSKGQRFDRMQQTNESQSFALMLAVIFVFLLMGILFESFVLPLSVLVSIPFAFVGAFWLLFITNTTMDIMSVIGFVILVGIVVNNAIVIIDLVNRLRTEGYSRYDAIIEAGKQRFRPILMTAFTTIGGLLPMAVGNAQMIGIPYAPMGRVIIGGLLTSTLLTLIAVPWAYTLFDDLRLYFKKITALYLSKQKGKTAMEVVPAE
ncbi:efflux RND transporter permease subunit [candidate division KSB1 bacterium]|nr:efflux RND transporter permease subunit [candidate division KSB1 bacterium]